MRVSAGGKTMAQEILETITRFVTEILLRRGINAQPFPDTSLVDSGMLDSSSIVTLVGNIEKVFGVSISMADLTVDNFDTIELIGEFIGLKLATK
jgi:acyl carrier protein